MNAAMTRHPAWQATGWREWAEALVNGGYPLAGCRVMGRFAGKPELPATLQDDHAPTTGDPDALAGDFARAPGDFALGLRLFRAQRAAGRREDALRTLATLSKLPGAPAYLGYLEARLRMATGDGVGAWEAWGRYLQHSGQG